jgi:hypothetical protein
MRVRNGGTPAVLTSRMAAVASKDVSVPASHVRNALAQAAATRASSGENCRDGSVRKSSNAESSPPS